MGQERRRVVAAATVMRVDIPRAAGRVRRVVPAVALLGALLAGPGGAAGGGSPAQAGTQVAATATYRAPVAPVRVLRGFDPPSTRYGAGHLGVDLAVHGPVRAAGAGTVTFAGPVSGRGVVVVLHPDGIRTEYEPLAPAVTRGQVVAAGQVLGVVAGVHRGCAGPCLHWGARRGEVYLDPLALLRPLGPVRLLPWTG